MYLVVKKIVYNYRIKNGLNQDEMGELLGVSRNSISAYESGERNPSKKTLHKLLQITGEKFVDVAEPTVEYEAPLAQNYEPHHKTIKVTGVPETITFEELNYLKGMEICCKQMKDEIRTLHQDIIAIATHQKTTQRGVDKEAIQLKKDVPEPSHR